MPTTPTLFCERMPPAGMVFGCLLPVPWVGTTDGLLLMLDPSAGLSNRFAPLLFALVHTSVVGILSSAVLGVLFQLLPVVVGVPMHGAEWVSPWVALSCMTTASTLVMGFLDMDHRAFMLTAWLGAPLLAVPTALIILAGMRVGQTRITHATVRTLRHIGWLLLVTLANGATLSTALASEWLAPSPVLLNLHIDWGLDGQLTTLVASVTLTVLLMSWQTRHLPEPWHRLMPWWLWAPLVVGSLCSGVGDAVFWQTWGWFALAALALMGVRTVYSARRRHDPGWRLRLAAAVARLMVAMLGLTASWLPSDWSIVWEIGVLAVVDGGVLPVNAMLDKIIPFMIWIRLRRQVPQRMRLPAMQTLIGEQQQHWHARLLLFALLASLLVPLYPGRMAMVASLLFALAYVWLDAMLYRALLTFRRVSRAFAPV